MTSNFCKVPIVTEALLELSPHPATVALFPSCLLWYVAASGKQAGTVCVYFPKSIGSVSLIRAENNY